MANYALITGMDIESVGGEAWCLLQGKVLGHAYSNTVEIHNFLRSIGYISVHIIGSSVFRIDFEKELKSICTKLKDGDKFFLYYYGPATFDRHDQYIFSSGARVNIELIEKYTAICGVERIILLDLYRSNEYHSIGETGGIRDELVERVVENASSNSPIGFYYNYNETSFPIEFYFNNNDTFPPEGESLFAKTVLGHFSLQAQQGHEISFPAIGELISETFKKEESNITPGAVMQHPCFIGNNVILFPRRKVVSSNLPRSSEKQKREKGKADQQLELVLHEHEKWLSNGRPIGNSDRLTWQKLEPIFAIYERYNLGPVELTDRKFDYADLTSARFSYGTRLSGSSLCNSLFDHARFDGVNFSNCKMEECIFESTTATQCEFCRSSFNRSRFRSSDFICCNFNEASMFECNFFMTAVDKSFFIDAHLISSVVFGCRAHKTNFTNASLACSILNGTDFSGAILTGVNLCGSAHADWCIEGVECQYVYWDREGKERFPPDNDFHEGEFYTQYRPYAEFSYTFKEGMTPLDLMLATHIVDQINAADMGFKIKIDNASVRGLNPTLNFIMISGEENKELAKEQFSRSFEEKALEWKNEMRDLYQQLAAEKDKRADLATKYIEMNADYQKIISQALPLMLETVDQVTKRPPPARMKATPTHPSQTGEKLSVWFSDKQLAVTVESYDAILFNTVRQYAVFRAVIKASIKKKDRIELSDIVTYARDIEEALINNLKKEKYSYIDAATDVSNVCCTLRKYCYNNPKLNFLIPLIPQAGHTMIDPAGFTFENESKLATNGRRISSY